MTTKRNTISKHQKNSNVLKRSSSKKRHADKKRTPALVPVPRNLAFLLDLTNLLPAHFRSPYWARRNEEKLREFNYALYEEDILNWQFGKESTMAKVARWIEKPILDEWRVNSPTLLWVMLQAVLKEMPIELQAFVLRDEQGNEVVFNGKTERWGVHPDLQSWQNLSIIRNSECELERIVQEASKRIEKSIEDDLSGKRLPQIPDFDHPEGLLERARQRLILVLGLQELLSYLMHPGQSEEFFFAATYYQSDAARSHFYIDGEGKVRFTPPSIIRLLEGIEAARIKECPICFKFFWAGRKDKRCCSTQCANTLRMREYRQRYHMK